MSRIRTAVLTICLAAGLNIVPGARSAELTVCAFGGPTPGYKAVRFDLPQGTGYIGIDPHGTRAGRGLSGEDNWHLAQGLVIVNAATLELESYRVESRGTIPRHVIADANGVQLVSQPASGPDGPFQHTAARPRSGLAPGVYYAIGFGSDGGRALPNEWWGYDVRILGRHSCAPVGAGETFEFDQSDFTGGTHVYAGAAGMAEGITHTFEAPRRLIVGLIDVAVQLAGEAELEHAAPDRTAVIFDEIVPFASVGGTHTFTGSYMGAFPMFLGAGVTIDLP